MNEQIVVARGFTPEIGKDVFLAGGAYVIGDVVLGDRVSVWFNCTLRGDVMPIRIGRETNIQDGCVVHGTHGKYGVAVGERVTVGHGVILHGTTVGNNCLIGMGSVLMDGSVIGDNSVVGAGSLVTEGSSFPPGSLILGRPAKVKRALTPEELKFLSQSADNYLLYKTWY